MKVLVLNRAPLSAVPYHEWLGPDAEIVLITDAALDGPAGHPTAYREVVGVPDYVGNPMVEVHARRLHERYGFDAVVALAERDVLRAARLRQRFGLAGQTTDSAPAFRDKAVMKDLVSAAGLPVAEYHRVGSVADLLDAPARLGYPFVVKPRREAGATGVCVLHDDEDLLGYLQGSGELRRDDPAQLLVEEYLPHELFLVDGLVSDGRLAWCWPSWMSSNLGHHRGEALCCSLLEAADPLHGRLTELAERALAALPPLDHAIIHLEVFGTARGLVFNEVASRIGGARIDQMLAAGFGVGLVEAYLRGVAGDRSAAARPPAVPLRQAGFAMIRPRPGVLASLPRQCPVPGVLTYETMAAVGTRLSRPDHVTSSIASVLTVGESRAVAEKHLAEAQSWLDREIVITPEPESVEDLGQSG